MNDWYLQFQEFTNLLMKLLRDNLVMVIGLGEDASVYEANTLVVVKRADEKIKSLVFGAELQLNDKYSSTISCHLTDLNDKSTISYFSKVGNGNSDCYKAFKEFSERVIPYVKHVMLIGLYDENIYLTNFIVFVNDINNEKIREVVKDTMSQLGKYFCKPTVYLTDEKFKVKLNEEVRGIVK